MKRRITSDDAAVEWNGDAIVEKVATFCQANNIKTDAQLDAAITTAINGCTGLNVGTKALLKAFFCNFVKLT